MAPLVCDTPGRDGIGRKQPWERQLVRALIRLAVAHVGSCGNDPSMRSSKREEGAVGWQSLGVFQLQTAESLGLLNFGYQMMFHGVFGDLQVVPAKE